LVKGIIISQDVSPDDLILFMLMSLLGHVVYQPAQECYSSVGCRWDIMVKAYCNESEAVIIDVSDNGPMIPEDVAQHIFVPFFTTTKKAVALDCLFPSRSCILAVGLLYLKVIKEKD
jgi:K+-sensing histidine kinase KdpD